MLLCFAYTVCELIFKVSCVGQKIGVVNQMHNELDYFN